MIRLNKHELSGTLRRLGVLVGLLVLAGIIISAVESKKSSTTKAVLIDIQALKSGASLLNIDDVLTTIERSFGYNLEGIPVAELDVARVERVLEDDPFVLDAEVYVDAQEQIHIGIQPREPLLRIIDKNGSNYYLDAEGVKMNLSKHFSARVPVITGNIPPYTADFLVMKEDHLLRDIFHLTNTLVEDDFLGALIEQIYVNNQAEITLIPSVGNQKILLGEYEDVEDKLKRLKVFYKEGIPYVGWNKYKTINLKNKGQVVCKRNDRRSSNGV